VAEDLNKERLKILKEIEKLKRDIAASDAQEIRDTKKVNELNTKRITLATKLKNINIQIQQSRTKVSTDVLQSISDQEQGLKSLTGIYLPIQEIEKRRIQSLHSSAIQSEHNLNILERSQEINEQIANLTSSDITQKELLNREFESELGNIKKIGSIDRYPNLKKQVESLRVTNSLANEYAHLTENQKEQLDAQIAVYDGIKKSIGGVLDTASLMLSNASAGIGFLTIGLGQVVGKIGEMNSEFGLTLSSTDGIARRTALMSTVFDDATGTATELANQFGNTESASLGTQLNTNLLALNLGISGKEAATLVGSFARLNNGSKNIAEDLITSTKEFAKQRGVIPSQVMSDLANNTEAFALFGKDGGKNLASAAVFARQLGTELSTMVGIADNLLDFESSITKELELSSLLGRNINLERARGLAFQNDLEGATKEVLHQLGGINAFEQMNYYQRKASADLIGVSVVELQRMATQLETANTETTFFQRQFSSLNELATGLTNKISGPFLSALGSGLVALGQMSGGLQNIFKWEALIAAKRKASLVWMKLKAFFAGKELSFAQKRLLVEKRQAALSTISNKTGGKGDNLGTARGVGKLNPTSMLAGAAALLIVASALFVFGKAVQEFMEVKWGDVGKAVVSMLALVGAVSLLGALMSSGVGAVAILAGAGALLVIATSVLILGNALQAMGSGFEMLSSGISSLIPQLTLAGSVIGSLLMYIPPISLLSVALFGLAGALTAVAGAGLIALPTLSAIGAIGGIATKILGSRTETVNEQSNTKNTSNEINDIDTSVDFTETNSRLDSLIIEMKSLRSDLKAGKISVYLDREKVSKGVAASINRSTENSYGLL